MSGRERRTPARVPASTYRFQVSSELDLHEVARLATYVRELGADWLYLSPLLAAEPGSTHGYDVVAHDHLDPDRGGEEGLAAVAVAVRELGLGVLVDIVPNHVGVATPAEDPWWWDVLRHGRQAEHAPAFDVDWDAAGQRLRIPVVGDDDLLPDGGVDHLTLVEGDPERGGGLELHYWDQAFPVAPGTASGVDDDPQAVHARQHYELVDWHRADDDLNYRRFFAVNTLAAVRVEEPEVFADTHVEIGRWFREGLVDGLRVDHPDGLRDPKGYLDDLSRLTGGAYVLVEKILEPGEDLPAYWACEGTTGYDALALVDRVLVDPAGEEPLTALEARLRGLVARSARTSTSEDAAGRGATSASDDAAGRGATSASDDAAGRGATSASEEPRDPATPEAVDFHAMVHDLKREVADGILHSEVARIVRDLRHDVPRLDRARGEDAVAELLACFPVYRSYLSTTERDGEEHLDVALADARARRPDLAATYDVLEPWLRDPSCDGARRFQQTSGMVMAKGVEDCAFYRYSRLTSLNEVGGDPSVFSLTVDAFHEAMAARQRDWPHAMTTLSTHDTKRGEDVRARIHVLAEAPEGWAAALDRLLELVPLPDPVFANLLWQAVVGAWPASTGPAPGGDFRERLHGYAMKAMREAGDRTTWTEPDDEYEAAVHAAVDAALDRPEVRGVLMDVLAWTVDPGWSNSLAAKLLALTMPGVPDVYQGSELWEQSLVDPDNRRPVDHDLRRSMLAAGPGVGQGALVGGLEDPGTAKLHVVSTALRLRRDRPELFTSYAGVPVTGAAADHVLAFDRGGAITVATRLPLGLRSRGGWGDTALALPEGTWRDALTGRVTNGSLESLLSTYPVALLVKED